MIVEPRSHWCFAMWQALQLVEGTGLHKRVMEGRGSVLEGVLGQFYLSYRGSSSVTMATQTEPR